MKIAMIFPDEASFYERMGVEIYENYPAAEKIFKEAGKTAKIDYESLLMYEHEPFYWDETDRKIAVLVSSVSLFTVWKQAYNITPDLFWGSNTGYLAALVCEEVISLKSAIGFIKGKRPTSLNIKKPASISLCGNQTSPCTTKKEVAAKIEEILWKKSDDEDFQKVAASYHVDAVIEIGPNNIISSHLDKMENVIPHSYFDTQNDCNYVLENVQYQKFLNKRYAIKRMLAYVVCTKNLSEDEESESEIIEVYNELRDIVDQHNREEQQGSTQTIEDSVFEHCHQLLMRNFEIKKTPESEICERMQMLEEETLLQFKF